MRWALAALSFAGLLVLALSTAATRAENLRRRRELLRGVRHVERLEVSLSARRIEAETHLQREQLLRAYAQLKAILEERGR